MKAIEGRKEMDIVYEDEDWQQELGFQRAATISCIGRIMTEWGMTFWLQEFRFLQKVV